jgi:hypothetical protein
LLTLMQNMDPAAIDTFRCRLMRRAVYQGHYKMITVGDEPDELFNVVEDPGETRNLLNTHRDEAARLEKILTTFVEQAQERRPGNWEASRELSLDDEVLADRLRALGYIE